MPISAPDTLLTIAGLQAGYGKIGVLHGVDMTVRRGEVVALLGPNGAGKTTLLRAVSGLLPSTAGSVRFDDQDLRGIGPRETARRGLVHVIEGHRVFTQLSVADNLLLAGYDLPRGERNARVEEALTHFPELAAKRGDRGSALSGGQQQMLAVAQGLVRRPRLLMLDEPSAGLSPVLVDRVLAVARRAEGNRHRDPAGRTVDRESAGARRQGLRASPRPCRVGGRHQRTEPAASTGTRLFWPGRAERDPHLTGFVTRPAAGSPPAPSSGTM